VESSFCSRRVSLAKFKNKLIHYAEEIQTDRNWDGVQRYEISMREKPVASFLGNQIPIATEYRGIINPLDIEEYIRRGGFSAIKKMFDTLSPEQVSWLKLKTAASVEGEEPVSLQG
jgi:NADH-quinone oxidoreductase subunit F